MGIITYEADTNNIGGSAELIPIGDAPRMAAEDMLHPVDAAAIGVFNEELTSIRQMQGFVDGSKNALEEIAVKARQHVGSALNVIQTPETPGLFIKEAEKAVAGLSGVRVTNGRFLTVFDTVERATLHGLSVNHDEKLEDLKTEEHDVVSALNAERDCKLAAAESVRANKKADYDEKLANSADVNTRMAITIARYTPVSLEMTQLQGSLSRNNDEYAKVSRQVDVFKGSLVKIAEEDPMEENPNPMALVTKIAITEKEAELARIKAEIEGLTNSIAKLSPRDTESRAQAYAVYKDAIETVPDEMKNEIVARLQAKGEMTLEQIREEIKMLNPETERPADGDVIDDEVTLALAMSVIGNPELTAKEVSWIMGFAVDMYIHHTTMIGAANIASQTMFNAETQAIQAEFNDRLMQTRQKFSERRTDVGHRYETDVAATQHRYFELRRAVELDNRAIDRHLGEISSAASDAFNTMAVRGAYGASIGFFDNTANLITDRADAFHTEQASVEWLQHVTIKEEDLSKLNAAANFGPEALNEYLSVQGMAAVAMLVKSSLDSVGNFYDVAGKQARAQSDADRTRVDDEVRKGRKAVNRLMELIEGAPGIGRSSHKQVYSVLQRDGEAILAVLETGRTDVSAGLAQAADRRVATTAAVAAAAICDGYLDKIKDVIDAQPQEKRGIVAESLARLKGKRVITPEDVAKHAIEAVRNNKMPVIEMGDM